MTPLRGGCHCGQLRVEIALPHAPGTYRPRACDCDFCRMHGAAYVSDPKGSLTVRIRDERYRGTYRQGSGQAEMLYCTQCGVLIGAFYLQDGRLFATVNSKIIDTPVPFGDEQVVSPRTLSGAQKSARWRDIWFPDARYET